ncbi:uncharacterized protein LOC108152406 [Drosophila miranda]|uniref:uncharacterized protein LOC108152406 n=1 Tax=Drosophila miranda TaxID=7229 RepID=UPI00143F3333|nr:uncharacterized protein LOC108152406 [Drosophila miranda]
MEHLDGCNRPVALPFQPSFLNAVQSFTFEKSPKHPSWIELAKVKKNLCNDVIEQTLSWSGSFNDYACDNAFAGPMPQKMVLVDPITC